MEVPRKGLPCFKWGRGMPGAGSRKRTHADARRALSLKNQGLTTRQIADAMELRQERIKPLILLGERLAQVEESK